MPPSRHRPWVAGLTAGVPISLAALVVATLFTGPGSILDAGPARSVAAALGTLVASVLLAELAAHRHVRPWVAVIA